MTNPFKFGKEVSGQEFYDRTDSFNNLYRKLSGGSSNVVMYAPRRYGKTSLVKKVLARFAEDKIPTIYFDLNKVETVERFCEEYASAIYAAAGRTAAALEGLTRYLSHLHPTISLGGDAPVEIKFEYGAKMTQTSVSSVLDLAERIASESIGKPLVVAFDEFQEIARLSQELPLEGIFRSCIQAHHNVRYLFLGSKTHMLKRMFGDKTRPFYKSAATVRLPKPPDVESAAFVKSRFAARQIGIDDKEAQHIVAESANIPYYLQQLSSLVFEHVQADGRDWVEMSDIASAIDDLLAENADYYEERIASFSPSQRKLLSALAREHTEDFTEAYRQRHSLGGSSTVHSALKVLVESGVADKDEGKYMLEDPFLAKFLCQAAAIAVSVPVE